MLRVGRVNQSPLARVRTMQASRGVCRRGRATVARRGAWRVPLVIHKAATAVRLATRARLRRAARARRDGRLLGNRLGAGRCSRESPCDRWEQIPLAHLHSPATSQGPRSSSPLARSAPAAQNDPCWRRRRFETSPQDRALARPGGSCVCVLPRCFRLSEPQRPRPDSTGGRSYGGKYCSHSVSRAE